MRRILLLRHPRVAARWQGCCYGQTDVELEPEWMAVVDCWFAVVQSLRPQVVYHSGLLRSQLPAVELAEHCGCPVECSPDLAERHFGDWEGRDWQQIYEETGAAMDGMLTAPDDYRPGGGETTTEIATRVFNWYNTLPREGTIVAVCHAGPIAALRGRLTDVPITNWPNLIPATGAWVEWTEDV